MVEEAKQTMVPNKHIKTLRRRLDYLRSLQDDSNSYDRAEIAALEVAVKLMEMTKEQYLQERKL